MFMRGCRQTRNAWRADALGRSTACGQPSVRHPKDSVRDPSLSAYASRRAGARIPLADPSLTTTTIYLRVVSQKATRQSAVCQPLGSMLRHLQRSGPDLAHLPTLSRRITN